MQAATAGRWAYRRLHGGSPTIGPRRSCRGSCSRGWGWTSSPPPTRTRRISRISPSRCARPGHGNGPVPAQPAPGEPRSDRALERGLHVPERSARPPLRCSRSRHVFRRVSFGAGAAGLLGQGSILMVTSRHQQGKDTGYTSPAARAIWIRSTFSVPRRRPFPNAQPVKPELPITPQTRDAARGTVRELPSQLLPSRLCAGELRSDRPLAHARSGRPGGRVGCVRRRHADQRRRAAPHVLLQYPEAFRTTITEKLLPYASSGSVGRLARHRDHSFAPGRYCACTPTRWSSMIAAIVQS